MSMKMRPALTTAIAVAACALGARGDHDDRAVFLPYGWEVDLTGEAVFSSDIQLTHFVFGLADRQTGGQFALRVARDRMGVDYEPVDFDLNGENTRLDETTFALQGVFRQALGRRWTAVGSANLYDGFQDFRSLWLAEFYRQQFADLGDIPGFDIYEVPDPHGLSVSGGLRWEYLPASGFLQLELGYARDEIAPGYEIDFDGLTAGTKILETRSIALSVENVLSPRMRSQVLFRAAETTEREIRWSLQGALNFAFSEDWRVRARAGGSLEEPEFTSLNGSLTLEHDLSGRISVFAYGRYYRDTGEIQDALLFSAAAPGLQSRAVGIGLKGVGDVFDWRISWAPYQTRYEPTGLGTAFFDNLFKDRNWNIGEVSGVFRF